MRGEGLEVPAQIINKKTDLVLLSSVIKGERKVSIN